MSRQQVSSDYLPARPWSHWMWTTFRDIVTGAIAKKAKAMDTTPLRCVNAQTVEALFNRDAVTIDRAENLHPTEEGMREYNFWMEHEGRYRLKDYGLTSKVSEVAAKAKARRAKVVSMARKRNAA